MSDDMNSVRCKACDKKFASTWDDEHKVWEELCWECLSIALDYSPEDDTEHTINQLTEEVYP